MKLTEQSIHGLKRMQNERDIFCLILHLAHRFLIHIVCTLNVIQMEWNALSFTSLHNKYQNISGDVRFCLSYMLAYLNVFKIILLRAICEFFFLLNNSIIIKYLCSVWKCVCVFFSVDLDPSSFVVENQPTNKRSICIFMLVTFIFIWLFELNSNAKRNGCIILQFGSNSQRC